MGLFYSKIRIHLILNNDIDDIEFCKPGMHIYFEDSRWNDLQQYLHPAYKILSLGYGQNNVIELSSKHPYFSLSGLDYGHFSYENNAIYYNDGVLTKYNILNHPMKLSIDGRYYNVMCTKCVNASMPDFNLHIASIII